MKKNFTSWMGSLFKKPFKQATCGECVKSLQMVVDGEATKEQEQYFMTHLEECMPCYNFYQVEKSVKLILQNKIEKKSVPPLLAENILAQLRKNM